MSYVMIVLSKDYPVVYVPWEGGELVRRISLRDCVFSIWEDPSGYHYSSVQILHPVTGAKASVKLSDLDIVARGERRYSAVPTTKILKSLLRQRKVQRILRTWRATMDRARKAYEAEEAAREERRAQADVRRQEALGSPWAAWCNRLHLPPIDPELDPRPPKEMKWATTPAYLRAIHRNDLIWKYIDEGGEPPWPVPGPADKP
jgi:hypothetical protein